MVISTPRASSEESPAAGGRQPAPPAPESPPAPTRYLYHLHNRDTGDHFVTTDGRIASDYEARGYAGGVIATVYDYREEGTRAIATNAGTAYIFSTPTPATDPPTDVVALWYSTDGAGDFFYTTSESEAARDGWRASVIGYVGTPA